MNDDVNEWIFNDIIISRDTIFNGNLVSIKYSQFTFS